MATQESKRERFVRVVEARTNKIIDMIRLLGNCSNEANYEYDEKDVKKVFDAIEAEVKAAKTKFVESEGKKTNDRFTLG